MQVFHQICSKSMMFLHSHLLHDSHNFKTEVLFKNSKGINEIIDLDRTNTEKNKGSCFHSAFSSAKSSVFFTCFHSKILFSNAK